MQKKNLEKFFMILAVALAALLFALCGPAQAGSCGVDWQPANSVPEGFLNINRVTYGNGQFVATVAWPGGFLTSPDGLSWTWHKLIGVQGYYGVTWGGNQYVAVKNQDYFSHAIQTSPDGVTWTGHNPGIPGGLDLLGVTWNGSLYVAVGGKDAITLIANSADGVNWTWLSGSLGKLRGVTWNGNQFVAVGESPYISGYLIPPPILSSPDGLTWTPRESPTMQQNLNDVTWGGNQFVAVGNGSLGGTGIKAIILTSYDGVTWIWRNSGTTNDLKSVTYGANQFVAVGTYGTILTSLDGVTWTPPQDSGTEDSLSSVTWGEDRFVAVGRTILVSIESGDICEGDFDSDRDVDGSDLAIFAAGEIGITLGNFAANFGRTNCPEQG